MAFSELGSVFHWCPTLPTGFVLISDVLEADGSFLLQHFINGYVKGGCHTTIVGLENGFSHYFGIGRKLVCTFRRVFTSKGINLMTSYTGGKLSFVNGLASPYDWTDQVSMEGANPTLQAINQSHPFSLDTTCTDNPLQKLYLMVEKILKAQDENLPVCLVIDNLNYLANSVDMKMLLEFLHYCTVLLQARKVWQI
jgi:hypothetical protein